MISSEPLRWLPLTHSRVVPLCIVCSVATLLCTLSQGGSSARIDSVPLQSTQLDRMLDTVLDTGELNEHSPDWRNVFTGLLGGYQVYEHVACSRLLSLEKAVVRTQALRGMAGTTHAHC